MPVARGDDVNYPWPSVHHSQVPNDTQVDGYKAVLSWYLLTVLLQAVGFKAVQEV